MIETTPMFPNLPELLRQQQLIKALQATPQLGSKAPDAPGLPVANQVTTDTAGEGNKPPVPIGMTHSQSPLFMSPSMQIPTGLLAPGNINLSQRPQVNNPDGSVSTIRSMSFGEGGKEILIPTVSDDGRIMSNEEAIQQYHKTGGHLGIFSSPELATAYAQQLHNDYANGKIPGYSFVDPPKTPVQAPGPGPASSAYQAFQSQEQPQISQYHPSTGRKVGATLLGILGGPKAAEETLYSPFNKQMADYQATASRLKGAADFEQGTQLKTAQEQEAVARAKAQGVTAEKEAALRDQALFLIKNPEAKFAPKEASKYRITTPDGKILFAISGEAGHLYDQDGNRIPGETIANSNVEKIGTGSQSGEKSFLDKGTGNFVTKSPGAPPEVTHVEEPPKKPTLEETNAAKLDLWTKERTLQHNLDLQKQRIALDASMRRAKIARSSKAQDLTSRSKFMKETAQIAESFTPKLLDEVDHITSQIGPDVGRWNQFMVNKVGVNGADFAGLDTDLHRYAEAITMIKFPRGSVQVARDIYKELSEAQNPENLKTRIQHSSDWLDAYAKMHPELSGASEEKPGKKTKVSDEEFLKKLLGGK